MRKLFVIAGARPNFMKVAPILRALADQAAFKPVLVHTGQHYDEAMNDRFFAQLRIPAPEYNLGVGSGSHAAQTAEVMRRFDQLLDQQPDAASAGVLVVGDVNSTIACALVAVKRGMPVAHVEAGLRSFDRSMPEEINRILTDQISSLLFITERSAEANLLREGVDAKRIHFVGNVMIDTLLEFVQHAVPARQALQAAGVAAARYGLVTLHRPANVDDPIVLERLLNTLSEVSLALPLLFPVHPRTRSRIDALGPGAYARDHITLLPPAGYLEMLGLMKEAELVMTDSGGIQEETTALGVPCLTLRDNTERPITVAEGTNLLVGTDHEAITTAAQEILAGRSKRGRAPELWDGRAAPRIVQILASSLK
jgi:UDP-N-acetylglucosamine 2-epimerase (non-hydrolysing)